MKVAYFSPFPPERSGIADYSALLVPALRERVDLTVVRRGAKKPPRGTDLAVYHIGNNPEVHGWILDALRRSNWRPLDEPAKGVENPVDQPLAWNSGTTGIITSVDARPSMSRCENTMACSTFERWE